MSPWLQRRQAVDRVAAAGMGIVVTPLIAVLALAVRRESPGPGLLGLVRVGQGGRQFRIWKVRTMRAGAPGGAAGGAELTAAGDRRVTPLGARLRRLRVDELPQLWNVVRGDMALLGPRPEAPGYVDAADEAWKAVLAARPGIAGPTQLLVADWEAEVVGTGDGDLYAERILPVKLAVDRWYVEHASPAIDGLVVLGLAKRLVGLHRPGRLEHLVAREVPVRAVDRA